MNGKLVVADVFDRVFGVYRDQFTLLVPAALIVFVPVAIVNGVLRESGGVGLALLAVIIGAIATYWFQGMVVEAAHDIMDGRRDHTVGCSCPRSPPCSDRCSWPASSAGSPSASASYC